jgi:hypothetical protein
MLFSDSCAWIQHFNGIVFKKKELTPTAYLMYVNETLEGNESENDTS